MPKEHEMIEIRDNEDDVDDVITIQSGDEETDERDTSSQ